MNDRPIYVGKDLEAMTFAENYHRWISQVFAPFLGKRLVEVGAGTGSFSELLLENQLESLALVEPSREMYEILKERSRLYSGVARVETYNAVFTEVADQIRSSQHPDSIIYVNVLEHIKEDTLELEAAHHTLSAGGRIFIFVPALRWLYGNFDRKVGHFRRYHKAELEEACRRAGFKVLKLIYFDVLGVAPWWVKYCLLKSDLLQPRVVKLYDSLCVPAMKKMESFVSPPLGKNLLLIGEKG